MDRFILSRNDTALLAIDMQERLFNAMEETLKPSLVRNNVILVKTAEVFDLPIIVSEQYPRGLGATIPEMSDALGGVARMEKLSFSCMRDVHIRKAIDGACRKNIVVTGIETHVCVLQTVLDLLGAGYNPVVASDAVLSRKASDRLSAMEAMRGAGAVIYPTETIAFMLLQEAGTQEFKKLSPLFK